MLTGGLMMIGAGTVRGEWADLSFSLRTMTALAYLSTLGAIGGFVAYTYALRHLPVSFVSLYAYINPIIAVALGVLILGEPFNSRVAIAAALVFAGVAIVRSRTSMANSHQPAREKPAVPGSAKDGSAEGNSRPRRIA
jgi:drug/metabolite transporter (DMT)-like permease